MELYVSESYRFIMSLIRGITKSKLIGSMSALEAIGETNLVYLETGNSPSITTRTLNASNQNGIGLMSNKMKPPFEVEWSDYLAISFITYFVAFFNVAIWVWLLEDLFKGVPPMPLEKQNLFAIVITAISMMRNFKIKEKSE